VLPSNYQSESNAHGSPGAGKNTYEIGSSCDAARHLVNRAYRYEEGAAFGGPSTLSDENQTGRGGSSIETTLPIFMNEVVRIKSHRRFRDMHHIRRARLGQSPVAVRAGHDVDCAVVRADVCIRVGLLTKGAQDD
jgi:hypothetical protein